MGFGRDRSQTRQKNTYLGETKDYSPGLQLAGLLGQYANQRRAQQNLLFGGPGTGGSYQTPDQQRNPLFSQKPWGGWGGYGSDNPLFQRQQQGPPESAPVPGDAGGGTTAEIPPGGPLPPAPGGMSPTGGGAAPPPGPMGPQQAPPQGPERGTVAYLDMLRPGWRAGADQVGSRDVNGSTPADWGVAGSGEAAQIHGYGYTGYDPRNIPKIHQNDEWDPVAKTWRRKGQSAPVPGGGGMGL